MRVRMKILHGKFVPHHEDTPLLLPSGICLFCHNTGSGFGYGPCPVCNDVEPDHMRDDLRNELDGVKEELTEAEDKIEELLKEIAELKEGASATQDI